MSAGSPASVELENEALRVVVIPERGGEIRELWHRPSSTQLLWHAPWADISAVPRSEVFDDWYAGGWQELLPNGNEACELDGVSHAFHGESWALPWAAETTATGVVLSVRLETVPLTVTRHMSLSDATFVLEERVTNVGNTTVRFAWGHHPAFGGDFLEEGCLLDLPGGRVENYHLDLGPTSRLEPLAQSTWPYAIGRGGELVDLRLVLDRSAATHDVALVTDMPDGWFALRNPKRNVGVAVRYPCSVFPWLWLWQAYGGVREPPFDAGTYTLAVEPWTSPPCLARAAARGEEAALGQGETIAVKIEVTAFQPADHPLREVLPQGKMVVRNSKED